MIGADSLQQVFEGEMAEHLRYDRHRADCGKSSKMDCCHNRQQSIFFGRKSLDLGLMLRGKSGERRSIFALRGFHPKEEAKD